MKNFLINKNTHITAALFLLLILAFSKYIIIKNFVMSIDITSIEIFSFFAFSCSSIILITRKSIINKYKETENAVNKISVLMFISSILSYLLYSMQSAGKDYQSSITLLITTVLVGSGWWVQAVISKSAAKKSHSVNTLMSQRNSELFYNLNKSISDSFGYTKTINEIIARKIIDQDNPEVINKTLIEEYKTPAKNVIFIINYYEFICSGINNDDFDEGLMRDCLSQIIILLEVRFYYYIKICREKNGRSSYENIVKIIDSWSPSGSMVLRHENGGHIGNISNVFDRDEFFTNTVSATAHHASSLAPVSSRPVVVSPAPDAPSGAP